MGVSGDIGLPGVDGNHSAVSYRRMTADLQENARFQQLVGVLDRPLGLLGLLRLAGEVLTAAGTHGLSHLEGNRHRNLAVLPGYDHTLGTGGPIGLALLLGSDLDGSVPLSHLLKIEGVDQQAIRTYYRLAQLVQQLTLGPRHDVTGKVDQPGFGVQLGAHRGDPIGLRVLPGKAAEAVYRCTALIHRRHHCGIIAQGKLVNTEGHIVHGHGHLEAAVGIRLAALENHPCRIRRSRCQHARRHA